jgi:hypothetical protein
VLTEYIKPGHYSFITDPLHFFIHKFPSIRRYIICALGIHKWKCLYRAVDLPICTRNIQPYVPPSFSKMTRCRKMVKVKNVPGNGNEGKVTTSFLKTGHSSIKTHTQRGVVKEINTDYRKNHGFHFRKLVTGVSWNYITTRFPKRCVLEEILSTISFINDNLWKFLFLISRIAHLNIPELVYIKDRHRKCDKWRRNAPAR